MKTCFSRALGQGRALTTNAMLVVKPPNPIPPTVLAKSSNASRLCLGAILHSTRRLLTLAVPLVTSRLPIAIGCGVAVA
ncbi:hypothetical protein I7I50_07759 [Histoplasma capsulatum G186AR]|uniref:Uncharacterized protein n=1 Tax=Ajellomyces capsulatus TaxID=5037 RepID=A0A8H7YXQ7_AJECA|nr:hypothetical protein I7I52_09168 [Histoplasma capsulatum]QSS68375.1 hypothetical protein I7I50_07759 [Histoplasma capsulatum G186AR]